MLQSQNLTYHVTFVANPTGTATETVLSQNPAAHTQVDVGTSVKLTVPQPGNNVAVPDVSGQTPIHAAGLLGQAGLQAGQQTSQCSNSVSQGLVISSSPGAGQAVAKNSTVNLVVSSGPCNVVVQNVVGSSQGSATNTLQNQGLSVSSVTTSQCSPSQNGLVVSQNPNGGASVPSGANVQINVCNNTAPPTTTTTTTTTPSTTTTSG
jgi:serine/threonine-protein kinase